MCICDVLKQQIAYLEYKIIYIMFNELHTTIDDLVFEFNILNQIINNHIIKKIKQESNVKLTLVVLLFFF